MLAAPQTVRGTILVLSGSTKDGDDEPDCPPAKGKSQVCLYVFKVPVMY
jgi:hypothetical protein